ncbi:hypothetical protein [Deinococcus sp. Leaf326]|uniref:hypothetical protein n=1 Tax=Deinococcus sp. Leaf326 TaxID=1736338 RepID=UPI0006F82CE7|nr:hypothetical protein [Deinococcus sp. Leaf326]KQR41208.1 hypothetical protein ASF71_03625 [Deinococcus sp. Leaf326]
MLESPQTKKATPPPRLPVGAQNAQKPRAQAPKTPAARPPARAAPTRTPAAASGLMGLFSGKLKKLAAAGREGLSNLSAGAKKVVSQAGKLASNAGQAIKKGVVDATWKKVVGAGDFAAKKVGQFKAWYATPEGKAKFWKGVALTAVGVATVASGGALTAPALALAAGISAGGGMAATVIENKVFNSAAKAKAQQDKKYKYKPRKLTEGITARSVAVDALVGSVGGPVLKYGAKALVGVGVAVAKGSLPFAKGLLHGAAGTGSKVAARVFPSVVKTAFRSVGRFMSQKVAAPARALGRGAVDGARKMAAGTARLAQRGADKVKTSGVGRAVSAGVRRASTTLRLHTRTLRRFARNAPKNVAEWTKKKVKQVRRWDRRQLTRLKVEARKSPVLKAARRVRDTVDGLGDRVSRKLVRGKVWAADGLDALGARVGEKLGQAGGKLQQTSVAQFVRNRKDGVVKYLDDVVRNNPDGHFGKAIVEFRASGTAIRTHLGKVWGEVGQGLNKDLSRLLGRHGSLQADFKTLAEQGNRALYDQEVAAARQASVSRLRLKVMQDTENAELAAQTRRGIQVSDGVRQQARDKAAKAADDAVNQQADQLTRQAEKFVARHPSTVVETAALRAQSLEAAKKVSEKYFGKASGQKGLIERAGLVLTAPLRAPINDRLELYKKFGDAFRSSTPVASALLVSTEVVTEQAEKAFEDSFKKSTEGMTERLAGRPEKEKKLNAEETNVLVETMKETEKTISPFVVLEEMWGETEKSLNIKPPEEE